MHSILAVDDSASMRQMVSFTLKNAGFNVVEAVDGVDALRILETKCDEISMVVADIEMPNMDGFELTRRIKASRRFGHLPVIALTTLSGEEDVARGKAAGVETARPMTRTASSGSTCCPPTYHWGS